MIEIRYGEHSEQADLAGESVAQAREQYTSALGIPDKAKAYLNGERVKKELEPDLKLSDCDELSFKEGSKMPLLAAALLLTLVVTGGMFAYAQTSVSVEVGVTREADFVSVSANTTPTGWSVFGKYKGTIPSGDLFTITPASGYPGDLVATVYIGNGDELVNVYRVLVMRIKVVDSGATEIVSPQLLTLSKGEVDLAIDVSTGTAPFYVESDGGFYISHGFAGWAINAGDEDPLLYIDVTQR